MDEKVDKLLSRIERVTSVLMERSKLRGQPYVQQTAEELSSLLEALRRALKDPEL